MSPSADSPYSLDSVLSQSDTVPKSKGFIDRNSNNSSSPCIDSPACIPQGNRLTDMAPRNRSKGRDVHIFHASNRDMPIGGLILTTGVTNANLYTMIEIFVFFKGEYILQDEKDTKVERDDSQLQTGNYYIVSSHPIHFNDEKPLLRTISLQSGTRVHAFTDAVRARDRRCVITGQDFVDDDDWIGLEAAHIFPLAYEQHWNDNNYGRWISSMPERGGTINSVQNGLLLRSDIHQRFDTYMFSINPDDDYKIICFARDRDGIAAKRFAPMLDNPERPSDQLLRWHFRQAVLTNLKGAGEPVFEHDFPPGSDIVGDILSGPQAERRMEAELFGRLATQLDLTQ